jgi:hypothetical protein
MDGTKNFNPKYEMAAKMALIHHGAIIRVSIRLLSFLLAINIPSTCCLIIELPQEGRPRADDLFGIPTMLSYGTSGKVIFGV